MALGACTPRLLFSVVAMPCPFVVFSVTGEICIAGRLASISGDGGRLGRGNNSSFFALAWSRSSFCSPEYCSGRREVHLARRCTQENSDGTAIRDAEQRQDFSLLCACAHTADYCKTFVKTIAVISTVFFAWKVRVAVLTFFPVFLFSLAPHQPGSYFQVLWTLLLLYFQTPRQ